MAFLLDVNVLIARSDPNHQFHRRVAAWLRSVEPEPLLFCPVTENGFLRVYGNPVYPGGPGTLSRALIDLRDFYALPRARFIPDDVSLIDDLIFGYLGDLAPHQLTDIYLLGLAAHHNAHFATLDTRIPFHLVHGGKEALYVIPEQ